MHLIVVVRTCQRKHENGKCLEQGCPIEQVITGRGGVNEDDDLWCGPGCARSCNYRCGKHCDCKQVLVSTMSVHVFARIIRVSFLLS